MIAVMMTESFIAVINRKMRCIEIISATSFTYLLIEINRNMRCIEIYMESQAAM